MDERTGERPLRIGEAAALTGVSVDTLRYYERRGLIPRPGRRRSGYRAYPRAVVRRVRVIKWAQRLGFRLQEIPDLLEGRHGRRLAPRARAALLLKRREVSEHLRQLRAVRDALTALAACRCRGSCPIVERAVDQGSSGTRPVRNKTREKEAPP